VDRHSISAAHEAALKKISELHAAKARSKHPLWQGLMQGKFSRPQVVEFLKQAGCIPLHNHHYHGYLYINCTDAAWRIRMAEVVYEEGTGRIFSDGVAHPELYLRLSEAFGISRTEMWGTEYGPGALGVRHFFESICSRNFLEGFAALALGAEASGPGVLGKVSIAFQKHYGLTEEQTKFYSVHEEADSDHSSGGADFLRQFATTDTDVALVVNSVRDSLTVLSGLWDDIWQRVQKVGDAAQRR